jgi:CelD/BcsL family acetyltransferase involved in cellulose biosynthesis
MNQRNFGEKSYFNDLRFLKSFKNLIDWLQKNGMLTVTSAIVGDKIAAVDIGAVWGSSYTVLAGGTNSDFPGIAKRINLHHIEWACRKRFKSVDFLCGDFGWKNRFHLYPRPLFMINHASEMFFAADADNPAQSIYA